MHETAVIFDNDDDDMMTKGNGDERWSEQNVIKVFINFAILPCKVILYMIRTIFSITIIL